MYGNSSGTKGQKRGEHHHTVAQLNINSIRKKFDSLVELIGGKVDVLIICETKLDETFTKNTFHISGYKKPYRKDRNEDGGGVMIYVRQDIPSLEKELREECERI